MSTKEEEGRMGTSGVVWMLKWEASGCEWDVRMEGESEREGLKMSNQKK
jgi:hypothetical protein